MERGASIVSVEVAIVGCQYRPEVSSQMVEDVECESHLSIVPEPDNEYDPNALALLWREQKVGYVAATDIEVVNLFRAKGPLSFNVVDVKMGRGNKLQWFKVSISID